MSKHYITMEEWQSPQDIIDGYAEHGRLLIFCGYEKDFEKIGIFNEL